EPVDRIAGTDNDFRMGLNEPEWPPMSIPPGRGIPSSESENMVLRVLPDEDRVISDYVAFLHTHSQIPQCAQKLKELGQRAAAKKKQAELRAIGDKLYRLDNEEHRIANLFATDPQTAIKELRGVIEKRRQIGYDPARLISSLCALGENLNALGLVKEAELPLNEALKLSEKLTDKYKVFQANPNLYLGMSKMQSGDFEEANRHISAAVAILDSEKSQLFRAAQARLTLVECLIEQKNCKDATSVLEAAMNAFDSVLAADPSNALSAEIARLRAMLFLATGQTKEAIVQSQLSTSLLKKEEEDRSDNSRDQIDDRMLAARCDIAAGKRSEALTSLDSADELIAVEPGQPQGLTAQLAEIRAELAVADGNPSLARDQYQNAIDIVTETIGPCPRLEQLKTAQKRVQ
ncbi:MAG TPA: hypothetical protein V6C72_15375, partial [Chroococcales cyanobacterium]